jgi:proline iminopeptidase
MEQNMEFENGTILVDGFGLQYDSLGSGKPLLLLAGGPGASPEYLYPIIRDLSGSRKCYLIHQRGTGRSKSFSLSRRTINLQTFVDDVEALRRRLDLEKVTILGHSWGAMLAMAYASQQPHRVESLVLICPGGMDGKSYGYISDNILAYLDQEQRDSIDDWERKYALGDVGARYEHYNIVAPILVFDRSQTSVSAAILTSINLTVESLIMQSIREDGYDVGAAMTHFERPVALICARQDYLGEGIAMRAHAVFPNSILIWIERSGHFPWLDNPKSFFDGLRAAFASSNSDK